MGIKLVSSSGGSVELNAPVTASNYTMTVPANNGTVITTASTFAGTGPAFSAYANTAQTINTATITKVSYQVEEFDTNSCFDNATNYRFTPNVAGYYQITATFYWNVSITGELILFLYKNGSSFKNIFDCNAAGSAQPFTMQGSTLVYANGTTDYFEIYTYQSSGTNKSNNLGTNSPLYVFFQAALVRAA